MKSSQNSLGFLASGSANHYILQSTSLQHAIGPLWLLALWYPSFRKKDNFSLSLSSPLELFWASRQDIAPRGGEGQLAQCSEAPSKI